MDFGINMDADDHYLCEINDSRQLLTQVRAMTSLTKLTFALAIFSLIYCQIAKAPLPSEKSEKKQQITSSQLIPILTSSQSKSITPAFSDQKGNRTTDEQVASFKRYIDFASTFYRDDTRARLNYISDRMSQSFGVNGYGFTILMYNPVQYNWGWIITSYSGVWATISRGADPVFSYASYMFMREPIGSGRTFFSQVGQKGAGIDSNLQTIINNVILAAQNSLSSCWCGDNISAKIQRYLYDFDKGSWNVFCSSTPNQYLSAYTRNKKYYLTKPRHCYYAIYDMKF